MPEFNVLIKKVDGDFVCYIPDLKLIASAPRAEECYEAVVRQKDRLLELYQNAGLEGEIPLPADGSAVRPRIRTPYIIAAVFLLLLVTIGPAWLLSRAMDSFQQRLESISHYLARPSLIYEPAAKLLHDVAYSASLITPERKEQIRRDLRALVQAFKPFADELRSLSADCPQAPATIPAKEGSPPARPANAAGK
ncbi:MAG: hypothetical protein AB1814_03125 [Thermodesulfobacteriota bacterium]